jgi:hypothetical protein
MATDSQILENRARLWGMTVNGMTLGIWGMMEESATSLAPQVGMQILDLLEARLGKKVDAAQPEEALRQLSKLFVDAFGYASGGQVDAAGSQIRVSFTQAVSAQELAELPPKGVKRLFSHPFMCTGMAVLARIGRKARWDVVLDPAGANETITFDLLPEAG